MNDATPQDFDAHDDHSSADEATPQEQFLNLVTENPLPSVLAAAAVGAGLMALVSMMAAPSRPSAEVSKAAKAAKGLKSKLSKADLPDADDVQDQVKSLRSQLGDLAQAVFAALPSKSAVQGKADDALDQAQSTAKSARDSMVDSLKSAGDSWKSATSEAGGSLKSAGDSLRSALGNTWDQASDVLQKYQPQVDAVGKLARQNPMWAALIAGAAGTLIGWQVLGASKDD